MAAVVEHTKVTLYSLVTYIDLIVTTSLKPLRNQYITKNKHKERSFSVMNNRGAI